MAEHTEGPWEWWTSNGITRLTGGQGMARRDGNVLCAVRLRDGFAHIEVKPEDALLIAAAPELLELARALLTSCDNDFIQNTSHQDTVGVLADAARAVIAKATEDGHGRD
jgi:hypothetical protein